MKRARGFVIPELGKLVAVLLAAAALVAAIAGAIHIVTSYLEGVRKEAKQAGKDECDTAYKTRDLTEANALRAEIIRLQKEKEKVEAERNALAKQLGAKVKQEKENAEKAKNDLLSSIGSGALILRDGVVQPIACPAEDPGNAAPAAGGSAAGGIGAACYRLSDDATRRIVETASRADKYAVQLNAALKMLADDRAQCNGPSP